MTLKHAYNRFHQFGGWRLLRQYARMGMLGTVAKAVASILLKGRSLKEAYPQIRQAVDRKLLEQYGVLMDNPIKETADNNSSHKRNKTIWTAWWQGEDEAPQLVKACWNSQRRYMPKGWQHVIITNENYKKYISLPPHIIKKMEQGFIPQAMLSDLVRLELLIKYGGVWMDSTVLCTEPNYPQDILTCPLFLFQYCDRQRKFAGFSNWFISAERGNTTLTIVRDLLYQYWHDYDCVVEYYIFHLFINTLASKQPDILKQMPHGNAWPSLMLGEKLAQEYDGQWWNAHTSRCCFHKLNYRKENNITHSYCDRIIKNFR